MKFEFEMLDSSAFGPRNECPMKGCVWLGKFEVLRRWRLKVKSWGASVNGSDFGCVFQVRTLLGVSRRALFVWSQVSSNVS